jgi:hypothetical protein
MGENSYIQATFATDVLLRRNTPCLDRLRFNPTGLHRLEAEISEYHAITARGITF